MYAGRIASCPLVTYDVYADGTDRRTDGRTDGRQNITLRLDAVSIILVSPN